MTELNQKSTVYDCREDYVGISLVKLVVVELVQRYVYYFGWVIYYRVKAKCQGRDDWRKEFETTDEVIWLIYFQAVVWCGFLYYPYLAVAAPAILYVHFKFIAYRLRRWKIAPEMATSDMTSGTYVMMFLNCSFVGVAFLYGLFLLLKIPHYNWESSTATL